MPVADTLASIVAVYMLTVQYRKSILRQKINEAKV